MVNPPDYSPLDESLMDSLIDRLQTAKRTGNLREFEAVMAFISDALGAMPPDTRQQYEYILSTTFDYAREA